MIWSTFESSFSQKIMDKVLYPQKPVRFIITGPSEGPKSVFLSNLFLNILSDI